MTKWERIFQKFQELQKALGELNEEIRTECWAHRDNEYLATRQIEHASEHLQDAEEYWRKAKSDVDYYEQNPNAE